MTCYSPLRGFRLFNVRSPSGKPVIVFNEAQALRHPCERVELPCGKCTGCQLAKARDWSVRCCHEAHGFIANCWITLTYNDECLPRFGTLVKSDLQKFFKRLRKRFVGKESVYDKDVEGNVVETRPIRFFACGEYGSKLDRPHYHSCIFNFDFVRSDFLGKSPGGYDLFRSSDLEELWSKRIDVSEWMLYKPSDLWYDSKNRLNVKLGFCTVSALSVKAAAYTARYVTKKVYGRAQDEFYRKVDFDTGEVVMLEPEFVTMSRKPGIGRRWYDRFKFDLFPKDYCTIDGTRYVVPSFYDALFEQEYPAMFQKVKKKRRLDISASSADNTLRRLNVKRKVKEAAIKSLERSFEK